jgi:hypothetical protein
MVLSENMFRCYRTMLGAVMQRRDEHLSVDVVFATGVGDGVKAGQRTTDAAHPQCEKHADGPRLTAHHLIDQIIIGKGHGRLHTTNGNASHREAVCWSATLATPVEGTRKSVLAANLSWLMAMCRG